MDNLNNVSFEEWMITRVREYLRDYSNTNKLLLEEEHTDSQIKSALDGVLNTYNMTPPPLKMVEKLKDLSIPIFTVIKGAVAELLISEAIKRARNNLTYSDGNLTINDDDKYNIYLQIANMLKQEFKAELKEAKISISMCRAMRGSSSPYATLFSIYVNSINV